MKTRIFILPLFYFALLTSCKIKEGFITSAPPIQPFFIERVGVSYISPPPIMLPPTKTIDEIEISSQYFKIAVPLVLDRSGKAEAIKNLIDEQFVTALDKTKRFIVMDKIAMLNIISQTYETGIYAEQSDSLNNISATSQTIKYTPVNPVINSSDNITQLVPAPITQTSVTKVLDARKNVAQLFGDLETDQNKYQDYMETIKKYTDGVLRITITGFDDINKQLDIDYRINPSFSDILILYSGKGKIGFTLGKIGASLSLNREDIERIADDIVINFPSPDLSSWKIIRIDGKKISVYCGEKQNIKQGMLGYVVKQEGKRIAYRAMFEVTNVNDDAFDAELKIEDATKLQDKNVSPEEYAQYPYILNTIKVGEFVKMK
jgi:hypothetical protein